MEDQYIGVRLARKYRKMDEHSLGSLLDLVRRLNESKDVEGIELLLPFVQSSLKVVCDSPNADIGFRYAQKFRKELPNYSLGVGI